MAIWKWPVPGVSTVSSDYGYRQPPTAGASADHRGIDIAAPLGTPIVAAADGKVISSGPATGYGKWIRIDHGMGLISIYGHMSKLGVSVGATVSAGDYIADVGSEGYSTGPHLHFQIEMNGEPQNPWNFVAYEGDTEVNYNSVDSIGDDEASSAPPYSVYAGGTTVGQRGSAVSTQPLHPFVNIYIGDNLRLLSTNPAKPNIIQEFEYNRLEGAGERAEITLFDDNWEEIEEILINNFNRIYIQYGYHDTGLKSKLIKHLLSNYSIEFNPTGTILHISSTTEGVYNNLKKTTMVLDTYNPTEAVKKICKNLGYIVRDENFDSSQDIEAEDKFNVLEDFPITYINETIIPQASQENEELFSFYVSDDRVAYFKREFYSTDTDSMRTYVINKGYDSSVLEFSLDVKGTFGGSGDISIATEYRSTTLDPKNKSQETHSVNKSSVVTEATGDVTHTRSDQSNPIVDSSGYSPLQARNRLYYYMKNNKSDGYQGTLTILGDPTIQLHDPIRIINVTDRGTLHHTSGVYTVTKITDSISGGRMTTTLTIQRNAMYNVDGLEIINPKVMIK